MDRYTLTNGDTELEIWPLGARLNKARWRAFDGLVAETATRDEALGPNLNHGTLVGPVANRIAGGRCEIDGTAYQFERNENGKTLLHSGSKSTRSADWTVAAAEDSRLSLALDMADLEDAFPGNRRFTATYDVLPDGFDLTVTAITDAPTLVNFALHTYWTLDGRGRAGQQMRIDTDSYLPIDADTIPTGDVGNVDGTIFDLRRMGTPDTGIDHNFCLSGDLDTPVIHVHADRGLGLSIATNAPGAQVFTGKDIGIAIEPQHWPDAPNHPTFPSILLRPGESYRQVSRYRFHAL